MSKPLPDTYPGIGRRGYQRTAYIQAVDWADLIRATHFLYREQRGRSYGWDFDATRFQTTSGTYTTTDDNNLFDLSARLSPLIMRRPVDDPSARKVEWLVQAHCRNVDVRFTLERPDTSGNTQLAQVTLTESAGTMSYQSDVATVDYAQARLDGNSANDPSLLTVEMEVRQNGGSFGELLWLSALESRISAVGLYPTDLP